MIWNPTQLDIFVASQKGKIELIQDLVESACARAMDRDDDRVTLLYWAAINDRREACTYLIEQGASRHQRDRGKFGSYASTVGCAERPGEGHRPVHPARRESTTFRH